MKVIVFTAFFIIWLSFPAFAAKGNFETIEMRALRDVHGSVTLSQRQKVIVQVASLTALGMENQLRESVIRALDKDIVSEKEIVLLFTQLSSYIGFPRVEQAFVSVQDKINRRTTFLLPQDDRNIRHEVGKKEYTKLNPEGYRNILKAFKPLAPNLPETTFQLFGDAYSPSGLSLKDRQLATISSLAALDTAEPQLRFHYGTALHVGLSQEEIMDMIVLIQYYAGMPAAYNAALIAREMFVVENKN